MSVREGVTDPRDLDVAFSFLNDDEPTARALAERLPGASTFVFTRQQEEIAGADGVDAPSLYCDGALRLCFAV